MFFEDGVVSEESIMPFFQEHFTDNLKSERKYLSRVPLIRCTVGSFRQYGHLSSSGTRKVDYKQGQLHVADEI